MDDTIYRQAAIDALAKAMPSLTTPDGRGQFDHDIHVTDEAYVDCMQIIHELPSAHPERKTGRWKPFDLTYGRSIYACTACERATEVKTLFGDPIYKYCPRCGAEMLKGEEE